MLKVTTLAVLTGLAIAAATVPSAAQFKFNNNNNNTPSTSSSDSECAYPLNYMPRVTRDSIAAIRDQSVFLVPVCEDGLTGNNEDYGWLFVWGNVDTLRQPIARNRVLMTALEAEGYDQNDVVSLRFGGGNSIALYVHQRYMK